MILLARPFIRDYTRYDKLRSVSNDLRTLGKLIRKCKQRSRAVACRNLSRVVVSAEMIPDLDKQMFRKYKKCRKEMVAFATLVHARLDKILRRYVDEYRTDSDDSVTGGGRAGHLPDAWGRMYDWCMSVSNKVDKLFMLHRVRRYCMYTLFEKGVMNWRIREAARRILDEEEAVQDIWDSIERSEHSARVFRRRAGHN